jgi:hypothetical protein
MVFPDAKKDRDLVTEIKAGTVASPIGRRSRWKATAFRFSTWRRSG